MAAGFRVILDDLEQLASTFAREARQLEDARPRVSPAPPDAGDGTLNAALSAVLDAFGAADVALARAVHDHADKLRACHDQYTSVDADVRQLFNRMMGDL